MRKRPPPPPLPPKSKSLTYVPPRNSRKRGKRDMAINTIIERVPQGLPLVAVFEGEPVEPLNIQSISTVSATLTERDLSALETAFGPSPDNSRPPASPIGAVEFIESSDYILDVDSGTIRRIGPERVDLSRTTLEWWYRPLSVIQEGLEEEEKRQAKYDLIKDALSKVAGASRLVANIDFGRLRIKSILNAAETMLAKSLKDIDTITVKEAKEKIKKQKSNKFMLSDEEADTGILKTKGA